MCVKSKIIAGDKKENDSILAEQIWSGERGIVCFLIGITGQPGTWEVLDFFPEFFRTKWLTTYFDVSSRKA